MFVIEISRVVWSGVDEVVYNTDPLSVSVPSTWNLRLMFIIGFRIGYIESAYNTNLVGETYVDNSLGLVVCRKT